MDLDSGRRLDLDDARRGDVAAGEDPYAPKHKERESFFKRLWRNF